METARRSMSQQLVCSKGGVCSQLSRVHNALLLCAIIAVLPSGLAVESGARAEERLFAAKGPKMVTVGRVEIDAPADLRWAACGEYFAVDVTRVSPAGSPEVPLGANHLGPGGGSSYLPQPGSYDLTVMAMSSWYLEVVTPPREDRLIAEWSKPSTPGDYTKRFSRTFEAEGPWELRWAGCGLDSSFTIYPLDASGLKKVEKSVALGGINRNSGSYKHKFGGTYVVEVSDPAGWYGRVVKADDQ